MNKTHLLIASGALLLGLGATATAQNSGKPAEPHNPPVKTADPSMASAHGITTPALASKIIGTNIVDSSGKDIAEIKDLMVCDSGEVYACVERKDDMYTCIPMSDLQPKLTKSDDPEDKAKAES